MKSCLDCGFAKDCHKARQVAFDIVFKVKRLQQGFMFLEAAAMGCDCYTGKKPKRTAEKQLKLFLGYFVMIAVVEYIAETSKFDL
jgi:hypothetical protein